MWCRISGSIRPLPSWKRLPGRKKDKVEFLCNECCWTGCRDRKRCYEVVSRQNLGEDCPDHRCAAPDAAQGYRFSKAMRSPAFIGVEDIKKTYLPMGFSNFKIEGAGPGQCAGAGIFALLSGQAGASAGNPGRNLSRQHAGLVLTACVQG